MKMKSILFGLFCLGMLVICSETVYAGGTTGQSSITSFSTEVGDPGAGKGKQLTVGSFSTVSEAYHDTLDRKKAPSGRQGDKKKQ